MHRILTFFLGLHWMVQFALLAVWSAAASSSMMSPAHAWLRAASGGAPDAVGYGFTTGLALGYGLAAVLFLWMLLAIAFDRRVPSGDADDIARVAFAVGTGVLTLVLLVNAISPAAGLIHAVSLQLAALVASYVAVCAERRTAGERARAEDANPSAAAMALGAAHSAMLSRLSGRPGAEERF